MNLGALEGQPAFFVALFLFAIILDILAYYVVSLMSSGGRRRRLKTIAIIVLAVLVFRGWLQFLILPLVPHLLWVLLALILRRHKPVMGAALLIAVTVWFAFFLMITEWTYLAPQPTPNVWYFGLLPLLVTPLLGTASVVPATFGGIITDLYVVFPSLLVGAMPFLLLAWRHRWRGEQSLPVFTFVNRATHVTMVLLFLVGLVYSVEPPRAVMEVQTYPFGAGMQAMFMKYVLAGGDVVAATYFLLVPLLHLPLAAVLLFWILAFGLIGTAAVWVAAACGLLVVAIGWPGAERPMATPVRVLPVAPGSRYDATVLIAGAMLMLLTELAGQSAAGGQDPLDQVQCVENLGDHVPFDGFTIDCAELTAPNGMLMPVPDARNAESACRRAGKRTCRETEWEAACRSSDNLVWSWGEEYSSFYCPIHVALWNGRLSDQCVSRTGLVNMSGGAFEWVYSDDLGEYVLKGGGPLSGGYGSRCGARTFILDFESARSVLDLRSIGVRCCSDTVENQSPNR